MARWLEPDEEVELLTRAQSLFDRVVQDGDLGRCRDRWASPHEACTGHHPPEDTAGRSG